MKLIDKDAVLAEIERLFEKAGNSLGEYRNGAEHTLISINDFVNTLEVKEVYVSNPQFPYLKDIIDKVFGAGNLEFWEYDDAEQLVLLAKDEVISQVCETAGINKPYKDGNQWCILKGGNIQEGICGFGDTIEDALVDFLRNIPKIPLEVKEVDFDSEVNKYFKGWGNNDCHCYAMMQDGASVGVDDCIDIAKHFFELGLNASNPLTWEDMLIIHKCIKDAMNYHLYKMMEGMEGQKIVYEEVLKRFKAMKGE